MRTCCRAPGPGFDPTAQPLSSRQSPRGRGRDVSFRKETPEVSRPPRGELARPRREGSDLPAAALLAPPGDGVRGGGDAGRRGPAAASEKRAETGRGCGSGACAAANCTRGRRPSPWQSRASPPLPRPKRGRAPAPPPSPGARPLRARGPLTRGEPDSPPSGTSHLSAAGQRGPPTQPPPRRASGSRLESSRGWPEVPPPSCEWQAGWAGGGVCAALGFRLPHALQR